MRTETPPESDWLLVYKILRDTDYELDLDRYTVICFREPLI